MSQRELILPTEQVHERLGLTTAPSVGVPVKSERVDIRRLNIMDPGPAHGRWIDFEATLKWMKARSREQGGVLVLEQMIAELAEVTT